MAEEKQYTLIHTVINVKKNSTRTTEYSITRFDENERPNATIQLKVETKWDRKDGAGRPEPTETYEVPAIQLIHFLTERGEKKRSSPEG